VRPRHLAGACGISGAQSATDLSDAELLERFVTSQDEAAFAALMARHGPMVFGICRRLLRHTQDAEDAFQATFLILVRKAASIGKRELLGNWLYGVAMRVAARARDMAAKRRTHEPAKMEQVAVAMSESAEATDLSAAITEEVQRLPAKYRIPVVLCYLEGRSNEQAAGEMHCPIGTVKTRLNRAREMLRKRLTRRGLALSTAAFSTALSAEALAAVLPSGLIDSACKAALDFAAGDAVSLGLVSTQAAALVKGGLHSMFVSKMKFLAVWVLALGIAIGGAGAFPYHLLATAPAAKKTDKENIQGTWKAVSAKINGKVNDPENVVKRMEIVITADKITVRIGDQSHESIYKIDPEAKPKTIDMVPQGGGGATELGIYKLEGDTLTICHNNANNKERPKEFESKEGSNTLLIVLKRVKK
jgi:RNA polymerase sigma factor (sigma-70 family)